MGVLWPFFDVQNQLRFNHCLTRCRNRSPFFPESLRKRKLLPKPRSSLLFSIENHLYLESLLFRLLISSPHCTATLKVSSSLALYLTPSRDPSVPASSQSFVELDLIINFSIMFNRSKRSIKLSWPAKGHIQELLLADLKAARKSGSKSWIQNCEDVLKEFYRAIGQPE